MAATILNWLVADFQVFGLRIQNWMLFVCLFVGIYLCVHLVLRWDPDV